VFTYILVCVASHPEEWVNAPRPAPPLAYPTARVAENAPQRAQKAPERVGLWWWLGFDVPRPLRRFGPSGSGSGE
jgi:hypothetical protein